MSQSSHPSGNSEDLRDARAQSLYPKTQDYLSSTLAMIRMTTLETTLVTTVLSFFVGVAMFVIGVVIQSHRHFGGVGLFFIASAVFVVLSVYSALRQRDADE